MTAEQFARAKEIEQSIRELDRIANAWADESASQAMIANLIRHYGGTANPDLLPDAVATFVKASADNIATRKAALLSQMDAL